MRVFNPIEMMLVAIVSSKAANIIFLSNSSGVKYENQIQALPQRDV